MEEDIEILEEQLKACKRHIENYEKEDCLTSVYYELKKYAEALEHLIKAYKELEEENEVWKNNYYEQKEFNNKQALYITDNFIPVSLVEEKIEEIDKEIEYQKLYGNVAKREKLETKKEHFLEILESEEVFYKNY